MPLSQTSGALTKPHYSHLFYFVAFSVLIHIEFVLAHRDEEPEFVEWGYGGMGSVNNSSQGAGELIRLLFFWVFGFSAMSFPSLFFPSRLSSFFVSFSHFFLPRERQTDPTFSFPPFYPCYPCYPLLISPTKNNLFTPHPLTSLTSRATGPFHNHHDPRSHVLDHARLRVSFTSSPPPPTHTPSFRFTPLPLIFIFHMMEFELNWVGGGGHVMDGQTRLLRTCLFSCLAASLVPIPHSLPRPLRSSLSLSS